MAANDSVWRSRVEAIGDFFNQVAWLEEPRELYQSIADELVKLAGCDTVSVRMLSVAGDEMIGCAVSGSAGLLVGEGYATVSLATGRMPELVKFHRPIVYDMANPVEQDVRTQRGLDLGYRYAVTAPLIYDGTLVGAIDFIYREGQYAGEDDLAWITGICKVAGSIMGILGISDRMIELRITDEARRIGAELHDNLAQPVSVITLESDKALMALEEEDYESLGKGLRRLREASKLACDSIIREAQTLQDPITDSEDLAVAVQRHLERYHAQWGVSVEFNRPDDVIMVSKKVGGQVLHILNEALGNVLRHARAQHVSVSLTASRGMLTLRVEDNGCGFDPRSVSPEKTGIRIMKERASKVGGKLTVASVPGEGTSLVADIPLVA